jgi:hypothetical protein
MWMCVFYCFLSPACALSEAAPLWNKRTNSLLAAAAGLSIVLNDCFQELPYLFSFVEEIIAEWMSMLP